MPQNDFTAQLKLKYPLIVAPMAGGPSSVDLVVASCEAGALGAIGAAYSSPLMIEEFVSDVRRRTNGTIAINLFIPHAQPQISSEQISKAIAATHKYRNELKLSAPTLASPYEEDFDRQFEMVLKLKPEVFSFVFGILKPEYVKTAQKAKILLKGTATTLEEALELESSGVDAITLQGFEAGGHRGIFSASADDKEVPIMNLLEQCRSKIKVPLIAAGGIMNVQDIRKTISSGASAVQMGTAFLACKEAGTSASYRQALLANLHRKTKTTRAFSGRLARGLENRFMREIDLQPEAILPFQAQNKFTRDIRMASAKVGSSDFLSLWCGAGRGELFTGSVHELIESLF